MAYGLASLVDISRVRAQQHFPSDVVVGAVIGNLIAQNIYSRHHNPDLGGGEWRSISQIFRGDGNSSPANQGSPYVQLDSWVYPALDRLSAMGLIDSGFAGCGPGREVSAHAYWAKLGRRLTRRAREGPKPRRSIVCWKRNSTTRSKVLMEEEIYAGEWNPYTRV